LDFAERLLEDSAEKYLWSEEAFAVLRIERRHSVFQKTTVGGGAGTGLWSRPDFTLATIRRRKFDPLRYLDVYSFELKNLIGAHVVAVHEALAHTRFAHFAYLLCPRSRLRPAETHKIKQACAEHGVGLITFRMVARNPPTITDFVVDLFAVRRSPDPENVEQHLEHRLSEENKRALQALGGTP
jgi:hypothetical protein